MYDSDERSRRGARFAAAKAYSGLLADGWWLRQYEAVADVVAVALDDPVEFAMRTVEDVGAAAVIMLGDGGQLEVLTMHAGHARPGDHVQDVDPTVSFRMLLTLLREVPGEHRLALVRHGDRTATLGRGPQAAATAGCA